MILDKATKQHTASRLAASVSRAVVEDSSEDGWLESSLEALRTSNGTLEQRLVFWLASLVTK